MTVMLRRNGAQPDDKGRNGDTAAIRALKGQWGSTLFALCRPRHAVLAASVDIENDSGESVRSLVQGSFMPQTRSALYDLGLR